MVPGGTPVYAATRSGVKPASRSRTSRPALRHAGRSRASSTRPSATSVCIMASSSAASLPGRIGTHSSASRAVSVRRGSTTTMRPPRSRMARSRRRTSGAVMKLPFDTHGFAPMQRKWCVRSMSGIGMTSERAVEVIRGGEARAGVLRAGAEAVARAERAQETGAQQDRAVVVDDRDCPCRRRPRPRRAARADADSRAATSVERLVPADRLEAAVGGPPHGRAQAIRVVVHVGDRDALRADVAAREDVVLVAAHRHDAVALDLEREPAGRLAERAAAVDRTARRHGPRISMAIGSLQEPISV